MQRNPDCENHLKETRSKNCVSRFRKKKQKKKRPIESFITFSLVIVA